MRWDASQGSFFQRSEYLDKRYFSCREIAGYLGLSEKSIRRLIDRGELPSVRIGRSVKVDKQRLDEKLETGELRG